MGMFDTYLTNREFCCPVCDVALKEWQGYDGPCCLFVWKEGEVWPVDQRNLSESEKQRLRLPSDFTIYSCECRCRYTAEANCKTENGKWVVTKLVSASNAVQKKHEKKSEYELRLKWLKQEDT